MKRIHAIAILALVIGAGVTNADAAVEFSARCNADSEIIATADAVTVQDGGRYINFPAFKTIIAGDEMNNFKTAKMLGDVKVTIDFVQAYGQNMVTITQSKGGVIVGTAMRQCEVTK